MLVHTIANFLYYKIYCIIGEVSVKMKNQKCINCGHTFTYKERFHACLSSNYISCKDCETNYKITFFSRLLFALVLFVFLLIKNTISKLYAIPLIIQITYVFAIMVFVFPIFVQFKLDSKDIILKNEPIQNQEHK